MHKALAGEHTENKGKNSFLNFIKMRFETIRENWVLHVLCISLGSSFFGVGYSALPVFALLLWTLKTTIKGKGKLLETMLDSRILWVWIFYALFLVTIVISDIAKGGKWTHLDGLSYNLATGFFMLFGFLIAGRSRVEETICVYFGWLSVFTFLLLGLVEMRFGGLYRYHSGVFVNTNILFTAVAMVGVAHFVRFIEKQGVTGVMRWISLACAIWAGMSMLRFSSSDALFPVFLGTCVFLVLLSDNDKAMFGFAVFLIGGGVYLVSSENILSHLASVDFVSLDFWREFFNKREAIWTLAIRIIAQNPLLGVGAGRFSETMHQIANEVSSIKLGTIWHSHSLWLQHFVVHGVIAGCAFWGFLLSSIRCAARSYRTEKETTMPLTVLGIFMVFSLYGVVECAPLYEELIPVVWGGLGILMGILRSETSGSRSQIEEF